MGEAAPQIRDLERDLELMFERATSPSNYEPDLLAVETIVKIIGNDKDLSSFAAQKITEKVKCTDAKVALQALDILDECMTKCSTLFYVQVNKFRFLNELIQLVSPTHKGDETSKEIKCKILDMLLIWTIQFPQENKIKQAYDMLIKQGVVHEPPKSIRAEKTSQSTSFFDKIPKKLLLSRDPRDTQAANLMIKQLMDIDKRQSEIKLKRGIELKKAMDNASLLNDMLNNFNSNETTEDELVTIKELYTACQNLIPTISRLAEDIQNNVLLGEALKVNDCLLDITKRYNDVVFKEVVTIVPIRALTSLSRDLLTTQSNELSTLPSSTQTASTLDELNEIFSNQSTPLPPPSFITNVLKPTPIHSTLLMESVSDVVSNVEPIKPKPLCLIDNISEDLFKEVLSTEERQGSFKKSPDKTPLNVLANAQQGLLLKDLDLDLIVNNLKFDLKCGRETNNSKQCDDDEMIEITDERNHLVSDYNDETKQSVTALKESLTDVMQSKAESDAQRPLSNFNIEIDSITPGDSPPLIIMDEPAGLRILLQFAKDHPRDDISVIVITTTNHNPIAIKDYNFDASVSKPCRLHLQAASDTNLPGILPFRRPTKDITQIMLISNKDRISPKMTCIVSYCLECDPDPIKESITITDLPNY